MYRKPIWYETATQRRNRIKKETLKKQERLAKLTPEEREERAEKLKRNLEAKKLLEPKENIQVSQAEMQEFHKKLRDRRGRMIRYNCESMEQFRERIRRSLQEMQKKMKDKKQSKNPKKCTKRKPVKVKKEPKSDYEFDEDETPEEYIERKRLNFLCMDMEQQILQLERDLKKEKEETKQLSKDLHQIHDRAKALQTYFSLPICNKEMYRYPISKSDIVLLES